MIKKYEGELGIFEYDDADFKIKKIVDTYYACYIGKETDGTKIKIPEGIKVCHHMFAYYDNLETPPAIPKGVENCRYMFAGCENLKTAPIIPEGVGDCSFMFCDCINLKILPEVPEAVTHKGNMFTGCKKAIINSLFL